MSGLLSFRPRKGTECIQQSIFLWDIILLKHLRIVIRFDQFRGFIPG